VCELPLKQLRDALMREVQQEAGISQTQVQLFDKSLSLWTATLVGKLHTDGQLRSGNSGDGDFVVVVHDSVQCCSVSLRCDKNRRIQD
jgi:hypothetical protein